MAAWKLVSNDAKRTVAPPNAKHSTLLQGCFFMFLFLIPFTIRQQFNHCPSNFPLSLDMPGMFQRFVGDYAPFWCRNHCSLLLPLCVRNLLLRNHKRPSPRLDTGVGYCHQAALVRSCGASFACMVFRMIRHLRCLCLVFRVLRVFQVFQVFQVLQVFRVFRVFQVL